VVDLFSGRKWDLVGYRNLWFAISLALILTGIVFWRARGLNYGIDFTGGGLITYQLQEPIRTGKEPETLARARDAIAKTGVDVRLQIAGTAARKDQLLVRTRVVPQEGKSDSNVLDEQQARILGALTQAFPGIANVASEMVTPVVSRELIRNAIYAVAWGCVFILVWIRLRYFDFKWAGSALVALVHDVLVLVGVFAMTQKEINSPFVAAALTVVGYSVHDTIVIFDRIRENLRLRKGATFGETANISLLETMARSVNTVLTVLFVLVAVYLLGGVSLRNFTFALIVGMIAGGYSSIFTASQLLVVLKSREERSIARSREAAGRPARRAAGAAARAQVSEPTRRRAPAEVARPEAAAQAASRAERSEEPETEAAADAARGAEAPRAARKKLKAGRKRKRRF
jgi:preprotein translocase subunit SecF